MVKRILSALVLSAVLLTMLAACGNQPDETTPVSQDANESTPLDPTLTDEASLPKESPYTLEQLKGWGVNVSGSFACEHGFLGTYNGYAVYASRTPLRGPARGEIGGVEFWLSEYIAYAVKDGTVYELSKAYERGIISMSDLRTIAFRWYGSETLPEL